MFNFIYISNKLNAPLRQMSDFTLSPPILAAILCNAPPLVFQSSPLLITIAQSLKKTFFMDKKPHPRRPSAGQRGAEKRRRKFSRTGEINGMLLLTNQFHDSFECLSLIGHKKICCVQSTPGLQGWKITFFKIVPLKPTTRPIFVHYKFLSFNLFVEGKNKSCQEPITLPLLTNQL